MTTLDPFTQGYIAALLGTMASGHLAPETLAQVMEDCALFCTRPARQGFVNFVSLGEDFWRMRSRSSHLPHFPPLTPYMGDNGLIYLKEAQTNDH